MNKNFNSSVILTSQTREAILELQSTSSTSYVVPTYDASSLGVNLFYVNGVDISKSTHANTAIRVQPGVAGIFHVFTKSLNDFDVNLKFKVYSDPSLLTQGGTDIDVSIRNRPTIIDVKDFNLYKNDKIIVDNESSYLVLRTNPKFSGNIKLMVDSSDNLYIDTFKVSDILSNKKYRKQQVSANSSFSSDIRKTFESIPNGEIYRVDKGDVFDISLPKTSIDKQYNTTYHYGARLLEDDLYVEDYSILAPIWINSKLPDFFAVFRIDGVYNEESYSALDASSISNMGNKYITNASLIKSWSINPTDNLGKYLNSHLSELNNVQSPVYLPLSDYDHNVWSGISVKKGIIISAQETSYQFEKVIDNFTDTNAFISKGFERNNVICPNLINIEYAFNDDSVDMYTMHRYFGLYLSENPLYKVAYYKSNKDSSAFSILPLDGSISEFMEMSNDGTTIFTLDGKIQDKLKNRIFAINVGNVLHRLTSIDQLNNIANIGDYCNRISSNIFSSTVKKEDVKQFITVTLDKKLSQGDHLRVINKNKNLIWEIYGIETIIKKDESYTYCSTYSTQGYPTIYRNAFCTLGEISDQITAIKDAFSLFNKFDVSTYFDISITEADSFSIIVDGSSADSFSFQRITAQSEIDVSSGTFNNVDTESCISFFGRSDLDLNYEVISYDASYGPINFEFHGNRNSITADFVIASGLSYSVETDVVDKFQPYMYYQNIDGWNKLMGTYDVSINSHNYVLQYVNDPLSLSKKYMISVDDEINVINDVMNVYGAYPINVSLMGINDVKDFDFNVYDYGLSEIKSEYFYDRKNDVQTYDLSIVTGSSKVFSERNSYLITGGKGDVTINGVTKSYDVNSNGMFGFNTFDSSAFILTKSDTSISYSYLDGSASFMSYDKDFSEESSSNYYINGSLLKYSLTSPYVTKWVMQGMDCRNNEMRLSLDVSAFAGESSSNFIPMVDSSVFRDEISFPSFKYLSVGDSAWKDYVYYDINDVIQDDSSSTLKFMTIRDALISKPYYDVFSKLLFTNKNTDDVKNRTSILAYNKYKNSIDTVYSGLKLSISSNKNMLELANIEKYNRYKFGFVSTPSRNYANSCPIEVFINENNGTILMVWYQGSDILNYTKRNSSWNIGKSMLSNADANRNFTSFYYGSDASINGILCGFAKSPFYLNTSSNGISAIKVNTASTDISINFTSPLVQMAQNVVYNVGNVFVDYNDIDYVTGEDFNLNDADKTYNNFNGPFSYSFIGSKNVYGIDTINHSSRYEMNDNLFSSETCSINVLSKLLYDNNVFYHVIREDKVYNNKNFGTAAFSISINSPKIYKNKLASHNGGFYPKFTSILNFSSNEDDVVINKTKRDFICSNTNLTSYSAIQQLWYNKIVSSVTQYDVDKKNAINYKSNYNVFSSLWDSAYYNISVDSSTDVQKNGYESSLELPSFFGSKLIKLPHTLSLNKWDNLNSSSTFANDTITLKFNVSLSVKRLFKNQYAFLQNWSGLLNSSQFIDQYINDTVLNYYSINLSSISVQAYSKNTGTLSVLSDYDASMTEIVNQNFQSDLSIENGEYFYVINIKSTSTNLSYFVDLKINQK